MKSGGLRASSVNQSIVEEVKVVKPKVEVKKEVKTEVKKEVKTEVKKEVKKEK